MVLRIIDDDVVLMVARMGLGRTPVAARAGPPSPLYPRSPGTGEVDMMRWHPLSRTPLPSRSQM